MPTLCSHCGAEPSPGFRFCGYCGAALVEVRNAAPPPRVERRASATAFLAERRQLTVMFCDLVESTRLSGHLDPEELRDVVRIYQQACVGVIDRFDGHVAQFLGDGLLVYFGFPRAHEDDARRAVLAGLGICEAVAQLTPDLQGGQEAHLAVRVGIHTGTVVTSEVGAGHRHERLALGQTPNIAARLQGLAAPNTVLLSRATQELIRGFFVWEAKGAQPLKGVTEPIEVFRALHPRNVHDRFEAGADRGLLPLIGREREIELLLAHFGAAAAGTGQVVLLRGEAGIGKSRLLHELRQRLESRVASCQVFHCSAYFQTSPFQPLIELIEESCQLRRGAPPEENLGRLARFLEPYGLPAASTVPLLAGLLSLPLDGLYPAPEGAPQRQKERTVEILLHLLLHTPDGAPAVPAVVIVEDLHWADPSTLELLDQLIGRAPEVPLFALLTSRLELGPRWAESASFTAVPLERLSEERVEQLIDRLTGGKPLPAEVVRQVTQRTDGVPLFVEELTKMVLESGQLEEVAEGYRVARARPALEIPATLQDSLMARLDRLSTVKLVVQLGAVLGREFSPAMLAAISSLDAAVLESSLDQLVEAEILFARGVPPHTTYVFKHSLIQNAAYSSLLKSSRQQYHRRFAEALPELFPERAETQPELLAYHYTEANLPAPAADAWFKAGRRAAARSSNLEAIDHCRKGLRQVAELPEGPGRDLQELDLLTVLASALIAVKTYASPEVEQAYARAHELCKGMEQAPRLFLAYWGLFSYYLVRAQLQPALELGRHLLRLGESSGDPESLLTGHVALGAAYYYGGELDAARGHLEQALALDSTDRDRSAYIATGQDVGVVGRSFSAFVAWLSGFPDQALRHAREAIAVARELAHPFSLAFALHFACGVRVFRREREALSEWLPELLTLSQEQGFLWWLLVGRVQEAWSDEPESRVLAMRRSIDAYATTGSFTGQTHFLTQLAENALASGQLEEARQALEQGVATVFEIGEIQFEAELLRLLGELELATAAAGEAPAEEARERAEEQFHCALTVARRQGARALELRAALSLGRLWQSQGRTADAAELLRPIYAGFTEGLTTPDLRAARALLALTPRTAGRARRTPAPGHPTRSPSPSRSA